MRVLALDTTDGAGSVAIVEDDRVVDERIGDPHRSHTERLPTDLWLALERAGLTIQDIDVFAIASGPGSFTGIRTGIATIQGLAFVTGKQVVPISALEALAETASHDRLVDSLVGVWIDAHRRDVYSALFRVADQRPFAVNRLIEVEAPAVGDPALTLTRWERIDAVPTAVIGDGALVYGESLGALVQPIAPAPLAAIIGRMAVARARAGLAVPPAGVQPLYVRRPDVEVTREKLQHQGHNGIL